MGLLFRPYYPIVRLMAHAVIHAGVPGVPPGADGHSGRGVTADPDDGSREGEGTRQADLARRPPSARPASTHRHPRTDPLMSRLERLARLHESGQLNDWEFGVAKSKLLRM
jgi:hypothetical protein